MPFKNPKRAVQGKMRITEADEMGATDKEKLHTSESAAAVSVIMSVYNCALYLAEAIESILSQTFTDWELIICDDGSSDDSFSVAVRYAEQYPGKIRVIWLEKNSGQAVARNRCLALARGEYVATMDGDDTCDPERLKKELAFLMSHPEADFVGTGMNIFDENGVWGASIPKEKPEAEDFMKTMPFCAATCLFRREALEAVGGYREGDKYRRLEDADLFVRLYAHGYTGMNIREPLYDYREYRATIGRRSLRVRLKIAVYVGEIVKLLKLPAWMCLFGVRGLLVGLLPRGLYRALHHLKYRSENEKKTPARVILSFDDGRKDQAEIAGYLKEQGVPAVFNITTGYIEGRCPHIASVPPMSAEDVRWLAGQPLFEVASHGDMHENTVADIAAGREKVFEMLGTEPAGIGFASPDSKMSPAFVERHEEQLKKLGFSYVRTGSSVRTWRPVRIFLRKFGRVVHWPILYRIAYGESLADASEKFCFTSVPVMADTTLKEVKTIVELAARRGKVCVLMFHSISGGGSTDLWTWDRGRFEELVQYLKDRQAEGELAVTTMEF